MSANCAGGSKVLICHTRQQQKHGWLSLGAHHLGGWHSLPGTTLGGTFKEQRKRSKTQLVLRRRHFSRGATAAPPRWPSAATAPRCPSPDSWPPRQRPPRSGASQPAMFRLERGKLGAELHLRIRQGVFNTLCCRKARGIWEFVGSAHNYALKHSNMTKPQTHAETPTCTRISQTYTPTQARKHAQTRQCEKQAHRHTHTQTRKHTDRHTHTLISRGFTSRDEQRSQ